MTNLGDLGEALIAAGFSWPSQPVFSAQNDPGIAGESPAGRVIDYVMAASRLFKSIPVNLVLRAVATAQDGRRDTVDVNLVLELFEGQDLFRWKYADEECSELLIGARLQIEAELVCNLRLGGADAEASRIIDLIRVSYRAGPEDNEETRFVADIVYALGPDGPAGERYKDSYADVARALTELRVHTGVLNGRLMLQESALRRAFIRTHDLITPDAKATILEEATGVIDTALRAIEEQGSRVVYASRRTRDHLWGERAAAYGFLATDSAQRATSPNEVWSSYKAAREAARIAAGRTDSYIPMDIALWVPARILREASFLSPLQKLEVQADIRATLDLIDPESLDATQYEQFQRQRLNSADVLKDTALGEDAFAALEQSGSTVGYYLRAKALAPTKPEADKDVSDDAIQKAEVTAAYLRRSYHKIAEDPRCLQLLLTMEWLTSTRRWLFRGLRQPLPAHDADRVKIRGVLSSLAVASSDQLQPRFRYLDAVLNWLTNDEAASIQAWRRLEHDTEYVEGSRVLNRHVITDEHFQPRVFSGIVERRIGQDRWSVYVQELRRRVDLIATHFPEADVAVGRTVRNFAIAFNYRGSLADKLASRPRQR